MGLKPAIADVVGKTISGVVLSQGDEPNKQLFFKGATH